MPEDYAISYVTKIDIEGHEFESCVRVDEDYGVFNKSYTTEELQMLLVDKWGQNYSKWCPCSFVSLQNGRVVPVMLCPKCVLLL